MTASTWRFLPAAAAMEKGRLAYIPVPQDVILSDRRAYYVRDSGRVLSALLVLLGVVCCLAWMGGLIQLPFNSPTPERFIFLNLDHNRRGLPSTKSPLKCSSLPVVYRFDCQPDPNKGESECLARGCCWDSNPVTSYDRGGKGEPLNVPYCFYPEGHRSYTLVNATETSNGVSALYRLMTPSGYPRDVRLARMDIVAETESRLRVKISDAEAKRFEVPYLPETAPEMNLEFGGSDKLKYKMMLSAENFGFAVMRRDGAVIFDSMDVGGFVFSDQLLQISSLLPSHYVYGLGEHNGPFLKSTNWKQYTMWNMDSAPSDTSLNLYGSHPFYLLMEDDGRSHGVFLKNSNAMEAILQPTPALTFRTIGGILDLYFFLGPDPMSVVEQYTDVIGKPFLVPFWSLGYHQCRFGYKNVSQTRAVMERTLKAGIPMDVQWNDLDYMRNRNGFTLDQKNFGTLPQFVDEIHKRGMHYIPIVDPGVSGNEPRGTYPPYDIGAEMNVFVRNSSDKPFVGRVWNPVNTVWPDFTHPRATEYWEKLFKGFHDTVAIDGAWIDMNEPSNFASGQIKAGCPTTGQDGALNVPPYTPRDLPKDMLYYHTICPSARQAAGSHYNLHNMYGFTETMVTNAALRSVRPKLRPFIISRSTFPGQGRYGGHWTGDVRSDWDAMKYSISGVLSFNMFGIPMVGADICGFNSNTTAALCQRWMSLGAFYPFSRNHNTDDGIDQDPVALGPGVVAASIKALDLRYALLPQLYTFMVSAHLRGTPVARPLFFNFPEDGRGYNVAESEFMLGDSLLVAPVLEEGATNVEVYLPFNSVWYDYYTQEKYEAADDGRYLVVDAPFDTIPILVRGGAMLVKKKTGVAKNAAQSRKLPFFLRIYLDSNGKSSGELYWDDGDSVDTYEAGTFNHITFGCSGASKLRSVVERRGYRAENMTLDFISVFGLGTKVTSVTLDGRGVKFFYDEKIQMLGVPNTQLDLTKPFEMDFK